LEPHDDLLSPNKSEPEGYSAWDGCVGWAYCSRKANKDLFLLYFEKFCVPPTLSGAVPGGKYDAQWFNPRDGKWFNANDDGMLTADAHGKIALPDFPGGREVSKTDWALKLSLIAGEPTLSPSE
jgi:hypothetical protein